MHIHYYNMKAIIYNILENASPNYKLPAMLRKSLPPTASLTFDRFICSNLKVKKIFSKWLKSVHKLFMHMHYYIM